MNKRSEIKVPSNYQTNSILVSDSYFRVFHGFVHPVAGFGFVRQEQSIPITAWAKRRHAMHRQTGHPPLSPLQPSRHSVL